jgi:hypothetical protein
VRDGHILNALTIGIQAKPAVLSIIGGARQRKKSKKYGRSSLAGCKKNDILAQKTISPGASSQQGVGGFAWRHDLLRKIGYKR